MNMPAFHLTKDVRAADLDEPSATVAVPFAGASGATSAVYLSLPAKFAMALAIAVAWTTLSIWLSLTWVAELAAVTHLAFALIAITFIAYVPGFMNAFLLSTLLLDR